MKNTQQKQNTTAEVVKSLSATKKRMTIKQQEKLAKELKGLSDNPDFIVNAGYKWANGNEALWFGAEDGFKEELPIADYFGGMSVCDELQEFMEKHKLDLEWQDAGTILLYPDWDYWKPMTEKEKQEVAK